MNTTAELARETAKKVVFSIFTDDRNQGSRVRAEVFGEVPIQSALDQQAKAYVEALKVATDAFEGLRSNQNCRDCAGIVATNALTRITELLK